MKFKEVKPGMILWYSQYLDKETKTLAWANVFFVKRKHSEAHLVWGYFLTIYHEQSLSDEPESEIKVWNDRMLRLVPLVPEKYKIIIKGVFGDYEI
jgi:hypothetical protein